MARSVECEIASCVFQHERREKFLLKKEKKEWRRSERERERERVKKREKAQTAVLVGDNECVPIDCQSGSRPRLLL